MPESRIPSPRETIVSLCVLCVLLIVAAGFYRTQLHYNPAVRVLTEQTTASAPAEQSTADALLKTWPDGLDALTPIENFDRETLSDKIDGKAELYLAAGFDAMHAQRTAPPNAPTDWIEAYVYDMTNPDAAFSVFSMQRREGGAPVEFAKNAYLAENALFATKSDKYFEIVASNASTETTQYLIPLANRLLQQYAPEDETTTALTGADFLPEEYLVPGTTARAATDVFGYSQLDDVYLAHYKNNGQTVTLFVSLRTDAAEARTLADGFANFMLDNGGEPLADIEDQPDAQIVNLFDMIDAINNAGNVLYGIHEAPSAPVAAKWMRFLEEAIKEKQP